MHNKWLDLATTVRILFNWVIKVEAISNGNYSTSNLNFEFFEFIEIDSKDSTQLILHEYFVPKIYR